MGLWTSIQDSISNNTAGWFVNEEDVQTAKDVSAAQQTELKRQYDDGVISGKEYSSLNAEAVQYGSDLQNFKDEHSNPLKIVPWWAYLLVAVGVLGYFGAFSGIFSKR